VAQGTELVARHSVIGDIPLVATGDNVFRSSTPALPTLVFQRDSTGRTTGFEAPSAAARHLVFTRRE
jgi:hypothetical protein